MCGASMVHPLINIFFFIQFVYVYRISVGSYGIFFVHFLVSNLFV